MQTETVETLIIGGGQAGLATAYHLKKRGRSFVIVDALDRIGDNWRRHYDSLTLYGPAKISELPGLSFPGPAMSLPTKDEVAEYLEAYAAHHDLPVRSRVRVQRLRRDGSSFVAETSDGVLVADNVVVATGTYGKPFTPEFAAQLDPDIVQLHSTEYKRPEQLKPGPVLVVGAAHSGADVAFEVAADHPTILSGRKTGELPIHLDGPVIRYLKPVASVILRKVVSTRTPIGRKAKPEIRAHGGPLISVRERQLLDAGVEWVEERTESARDGKPVLANGRVLDVANVVWCTGFRHNFSWIEMPIVGEDGWPEEERGVVASEPGLYFMGLAFQYSFSSMLIFGAGQDAEYVAKHLDKRMSSRSAASPRTAAA